MKLFLHRLLLGAGLSVVHSDLTQLAELLFDVDLSSCSGGGLLLGLHALELMLVHDGLANVHAVHVASVANITEAEVQVAAVKADPVADSLTERLLGIGSGKLLHLLVNLGSLALGWAFIQDLVLRLNADLLEGLLNHLELLLLILGGFLVAARALFASVA